MGAWELQYGSYNVGVAVIVELYLILSAFLSTGVGLLIIDFFSSVQRSDSSCHSFPL